MLRNNCKKIASYFILWAISSFVSIRLKEFILDWIEQNGAEISTPVFSFYKVLNTGAAFNILTDRTNILIVSAVICTIIITAVILAKTSKLTYFMVIAMALLSSGIMLNTFERVHNRYVTDYIYFTFFKNFPVFNIPDVIIVTGALILAFELTKNHGMNNDKRI